MYSGPYYSSDTRVPSIVHVAGQRGGSLDGVGVCGGSGGALVAATRAYTGRRMSCSSATPDPSSVSQEPGQLSARGAGCGSMITTSFPTSAGITIPLSMSTSSTMNRLSGPFGSPLHYPGGNTQASAFNDMSNSYSVVLKQGMVSPPGDAVSTQLLHPQAPGQQSQSQQLGLGGFYRPQPFAGAGAAQVTNGASAAYVHNTPSRGMQYGMQPRVVSGEAMTASAAPSIQALEQQRRTYERHVMNTNGGVGSNGMDYGRAPIIGGYPSGYAGAMGPVMMGPGLLSGPTSFYAGMQASNSMYMTNGSPGIGGDNGGGGFFNSSDTSVRGGATQLPEMQPANAQGSAQRHAQLCGPRQASTSRHLPQLQQRLVGSAAGPLGNVPPYSYESAACLNADASSLYDVPPNSAGTSELPALLRPASRTQPSLYMESLRSSVEDFTVPQESVRVATRPMRGGPARRAPQADQARCQHSFASPPEAAKWTSNAGNASDPASRRGSRAGSHTGSMSSGMSSRQSSSRFSVLSRIASRCSQLGHDAVRGLRRLSRSSQRTGSQRSVGDEVEWLHESSPVRSGLASFVDRPEARRGRQCGARPDGGPDGGHKEHEKALPQRCSSIAVRRQVRVKSLSVVDMEEAIGMRG